MELQLAHKNIIQSLADKNQDFFNEKHKIEKWYSASLSMGCLRNSAGLL